MDCQLLPLRPGDLQDLTPEELAAWLCYITFAQDKFSALKDLLPDATSATCTLLSNALLYVFQLDLDKYLLAHPLAQSASIKRRLPTSNLRKGLVATQVNACDIPAAGKAVPQGAALLAAGAISPGSATTAGAGSKRDPTQSAAACTDAAHEAAPKHIDVARPTIGASGDQAGTSQSNAGASADGTRADSQQLMPTLSSSGQASSLADVKVTGDNFRTSRSSRPAPNWEHTGATAAHAQSSDAEHQPTAGQLGEHLTAGNQRNLPGTAGKTSLHAEPGSEHPMQAKQPLSVAERRSKLRITIRRANPTRGEVHPAEHAEQAQTATEQLPTMPAPSPVPGPAPQSPMGQASPHASTSPAKNGLLSPADQMLPLGTASEKVDGSRQVGGSRRDSPLPALKRVHPRTMVALPTDVAPLPLSSSTSPAVGCTPKPRSDGLPPVQGTGNRPPHTNDDGSRWRVLPATPGDTEASRFGCLTCTGEITIEGDMGQQRLARFETEPPPSEVVIAPSGKRPGGKLEGSRQGGRKKARRGREFDGMVRPAKLMRDMELAKQRAALAEDVKAAVMDGSAGQLRMGLDGVISDELLALVMASQPLRGAAVTSMTMDAFEAGTGHVLAGGKIRCCCHGWELGLQDFVEHCCAQEGSESEAPDASRHPAEAIMLPRWQLGIDELCYLMAADPIDDNLWYCVVCKDGGDLLCCDGCPCTFHRRCIDGSHKGLDGSWFCSYCITERKNKMGGGQPVHDATGLQVDRARPDDPNPGLAAVNRKPGAAESGAEVPGPKAPSLKRRSGSGQSRTEDVVPDVQTGAHNSGAGRTAPELVPGPGAKLKAAGQMTNASTGKPISGPGKPETAARGPDAWSAGPSTKSKTAAQAPEAPTAKQKFGTASQRPKVTVPTAPAEKPNSRGAELPAGNTATAAAGPAREPPAQADAVLGAGAVHSTERKAGTASCAQSPLRPDAQREVAKSDLAPSLRPISMDVKHAPGVAQSKPHNPMVSTGTAAEHKPAAVRPDRPPLAQVHLQQNAAQPIHQRHPAAGKHAADAARQKRRRVQTAPNSTDGPALLAHVGVNCDICLCCPIIGTRWKSSLLDTWNACSACVSKAQATDKGVLIQLHQPEPVPPPAAAANTTHATEDTRASQPAAPKAGQQLPPDRSTTVPTHIEGKELVVPATIQWDAAWSASEAAATEPVDIRAIVQAMIVQSRSTAQGHALGKGTAAAPGSRAVRSVRQKYTSRWESILNRSAPGSFTAFLCTHAARTAAAPADQNPALPAANRHRSIASQNALPRSELEGQPLCVRDAVLTELVWDCRPPASCIDATPPEGPDTMMYDATSHHMLSCGPPVAPTILDDPAAGQLQPDGQDGASDVEGVKLHGTPAAGRDDHPQDLPGCSTSSMATARDGEGQLQLLHAGGQSQLLLGSMVEGSGRPEVPPGCSAGGMASGSSAGGPGVPPGCSAGGTAPESGAGGPGIPPAGGMASKSSAGHPQALPGCSAGGTASGDSAGEPAGLPSCSAGGTALGCSAGVLMASAGCSAGGMALGSSAGGPGLPPGCSAGGTAPGDSAGGPGVPLSSSIGANVLGNGAGGANISSRSGIGGEAFGSGAGQPHSAPADDARLDRKVVSAADGPPQAPHASNVAANLSTVPAHNTHKQVPPGATAALQDAANQPPQGAVKGQPASDDVVGPRLLPDARTNSTALDIAPASTQPAIDGPGTAQLRSPAEATAHLLPDTSAGGTCSGRVAGAVIASGSLSEGGNGTMQPPSSHIVATSAASIDLTHVGISNVTSGRGKRVLKQPLVTIDLTD